MLFRGSKKSPLIMLAICAALNGLAFVLTVLSMFFPILKGPLNFLPIAIMVFLALPLLVIVLVIELSRAIKGIFCGNPVRFPCIPYSRRNDEHPYDIRRIRESSMHKSFPKRSVRSSRKEPCLFRHALMCHRQLRLR